MIPGNGNIEAVLKRMEDLERRVQELRDEARDAETREWRFWGRWGPLIYMAMGAMLAIALGFPNAVKSLGDGEATSRLEPQEYVLRDGGGRIRAKLVISDDIPQLTLYDTKGYAAAATPFEHKLSTERRDAQATPSAAFGTRIHSSDAVNPSKQIAATPSGSAAPAPGSLTRLARLIRGTFGQGAAAPATVSKASAIPAPVPARRSTPNLRATPPRVVAVALAGPRPAAVRPALTDLLRPGSVPHLEALPVTSPARTLADSPSASAPASPTPVEPLLPSPSPAPSTAAPALSVSAPAGTASLSALPASPSLKLTVLGYVDKPGVGREVLVSQNSQIYVTHEGETFADRFKVVKITPTVVEILDTYTHQTLQLNVSP